MQLEDSFYFPGKKAQTQPPALKASIEQFVFSLGMLENDLERTYLMLLSFSVLKEEWVTSFRNASQRQTFKGGWFNKYNLKN